jgi:hypothetical protein
MTAPIGFRNYWVVRSPFFGAKRSKSMLLYPAAFLTHIHSTSSGNEFYCPASQLNDLTICSSCGEKPPDCLLVQAKLLSEE